MSVKKKRIVRSELKPGQRVESAPCGAKGAFAGVVRFRFEHGMAYHVEEDGTGQLWHRNLSELRKLKA
jgi:hypothetical protein